MEDWALFTAILGAVGFSFLVAVAIPRSMSDRFNTASVEVHTPWKRPKILAGRSLVALWFLGAALHLALLPGIVTTGEPLLAVSQLPSVLIVLALTFTAVSYKRSLAQQPDAGIDERERAVRDRLYLTSYQVVASILVLFWLLAFALLVTQEVDVLIVGELSLDTLAGLGFLAAMFLYALPSLVHAWIDPVPDELSDEDRDAWKTAKREIKSEIAKIRKDLPKGEKAAPAELRKADRVLSRSRNQRKPRKRS